MPDNHKRLPDYVQEVVKVLEGPYTDAVRAHLEYEVFAGKRNKKALEDFESALAHLADALLYQDADQVPHMASHLQRIALETTEYVTESCLDRIRGRFDPYYRRPWVAKMLLLTKPAFLDANYEALRTIQDLIHEGRRLKGNSRTYSQSLTKFHEALKLAKGLDKGTPLCPYGERLFAVILAIVSLVLGGAIGAILTICLGG